MKGSLSLDNESKGNMKTDSQRIKPAWSRRAGCSIVLVVSLACLGSMPATLGESIEPIMLTGGAKAGSGGEYRFVGAVEPMHRVDSGGSETGHPSVVTGFWSMQDAVEAGPAVLHVALDGARLILFWPASAEGYVLQRAFRLGPGAEWTEISEPSESDGVHTHATVGTEVSPQFFRLHRQD
jgi:hypothetical protein